MIINQISAAPPSLIRLLYRSYNRLDLPKAQLLAAIHSILTASVARNRMHNITGGLLYNKDWFIQVLEGDADDVYETYRSISCDPCHGQCVVMSAASVKARMFRYWWMAAVDEAPLQPGAFDPMMMEPSDLIDRIHRTISHLSHMRILPAQAL